MDEDSNVILNPIEQYAQHLINSKVLGVFVCGTTGEGSSLTTDERKTILEKWISCSNKKLRIICHVGGNCLPQSIELAIHAEKSGADAVGAYSPSFFKPNTVQELLSFLAPIANSAPHLPFYYYHIPSFTGVNLLVNEMLVEAQSIIPNFAGIKFAHYDLYDMQQSIAYDNGKFEILHGFDEILLCGLSLGVQGAVGSTYNYMPSVYLDLWEAFNHLNIVKARELQQFSVKIVQLLFKFGGGVRAGKAIMEFIGINCGPVRLPIKKMTIHERETFKNELTDAGFFKMINKTST
jgi:N-acetylneuraminate lyase